MFPSQGIGSSTAEKQAPSALQYHAEFGRAIALERKFSDGAKKKTTRELLNKSIASFNRGVTVKRFRVEGSKKTLIFNLIRVSETFLNLLASHYDKFQHAVSGSLERLHVSHHYGPFSFGLSGLVMP